MKIKWWIPTVLFLGGALQAIAEQDGLVGEWNFDHSKNPLQATVGKNLELVGTHMAVAGPSKDNGAVRIGSGSYYVCDPQMGGEKVNEYSIVMDIRLPELNVWHALYQTASDAQKDDAECFVRGNGQVGVGVVGYSDRHLRQDRWFRIVISAKLGTNEAAHVDYYLDGNLILEGKKQIPNGRFSLNPRKLFFFSDNNGEDAPIDVAKIALFNRALSALDVAEIGLIKEPQMGSVETSVPRVEFLDAHRAVLKWESDAPTDAFVEYGKTKALGSFQGLETLRKRHELVLPGLQWRTKYWYRIGYTENGKKVFSPLYWFDNAINFTKMDASNIPSPWEADEKTEAYVRSAKYILDSTGIDRGYALVYGIGDGRLLFELAKHSKLMVYGVDSDQKRIDAAFEKLASVELYGTRVKLLKEEDLSALPFTKDFFNLVVSGRAILEGTLVGTSREALRVVAPSGGTILMGSTDGLSISAVSNWFAPSAISAEFQSLEKGSWAKYVRPELPHTGWWTHQYGTPANSGYAEDQMGGASSAQDMQLQWLGRPGADSGLDRNPRMPAAVSSNGRIYHQGYNRIMAMDAYNGSLLWSLEIPALRRVNLPRDTSNMCADDEGVYLAVKDECWKLDGNSGALLRRYRIREPGMDWGALFRYDDLLIGSRVPKRAHYWEFWGASSWYDQTKGPQTDKVCSPSLFALDPESGKSVWGYTHGVIVEPTICMGNDRVYFMESRNPDNIALGGGRYGSNLWKDLYLVALDAKSGKLLWERPIDPKEGVVVVYMMYAPAEDKLVLSTSDTAYNLYVFSAKDGSKVWDMNGQAWIRHTHSAHMQRPVVIDDKIFYVPKLFKLADGTVLRDDLGNLKSAGCPTYTASSNALIYRGPDRKMTVQNLKTGELTSWNYLRPGCWLNWMQAGGMFLMPEQGGGCSCNGWINTSVGFASKGEE